MAAEFNSFNIADLYLKVFGIKGVRFAIPTANIVQSAEVTATFAAGQYVNRALNSSKTPYSYQGIETIPLPQAKAKSILGTPIYEQLTLSLPGVFDYTLPGWPLFDITGQDTIIKTPMTGKKGTVKEYISEDDYSITIRGFLINDDSNEFPEQQLADLMQVIKAKKSMQITSQVFNLMDIHNIVIERHTFPAVEGYQNMQPFVLECLSDEPAELEIKSVKTKKAIIQGL